MVLDGVLAELELTWLGLARDKVAAFTSAPWCVPSDALPQTTVGGVVRLFPDPYAYLRTLHQVLEPVAGDGVETGVELVPVTHAYLRLERLVGTA
jgi:hypothetical protein